MVANKGKNLFTHYKSLVGNAFADLKTKGKRKRQIPNIISAVRLLAPIVIIPIAIMGNALATAIFIILFAATDGIDGFIARKYKWTSELGKDLDAFSDKVFASVVMILASMLNPLLIINLGFEIAIVATNVKAKTESQKISASIWGKVKMAILYSLIAVSFLSSIYDMGVLFNLLFGTTVALQGIATALYIKEYRDKKKSVIFQSEEEKNQVYIESDEVNTEFSKQKTMSRKAQISWLNNFRNSVVDNEQKNDYSPNNHPVKAKKINKK